MNTKEELKKMVAAAVMEYLEDEMVVGLGSGSTMAYVIDNIGKGLRDGHYNKIFGVPTSFQSEILGRENGIQILDFNYVDKIDISIDGADEIDPNKYLIKGGGGAHTREKYVDYYADRFIVVADESKLVNKLGTTFRVPIEVLPQAYKSILRKLEKLDSAPELRIALKKAGPVITDQGNFIIDAKFEGIDNPKELERTLNNIPGVIENGIFTVRVEAALIGNYSDGNTKVIRL